MTQMIQAKPEADVEKFLTGLNRIVNMADEVIIAEIKRSYARAGGEFLLRGALASEMWKRYNNRGERTLGMAKLADECDVDRSTLYREMDIHDAFFVGHESEFTEMANDLGRKGGKSYFVLALSSCKGNHEKAWALVQEFRVRKAEDPTFNLLDASVLASERAGRTTTIVEPVQHVAVAPNLTFAPPQAKQVPPRADDALAAFMGTEYNDTPPTVERAPEPQVDKTIQYTADEIPVSMEVDFINAVVAICNRHDIDAEEMMVRGRVLLTEHAGYTGRHVLVDESTYRNLSFIVKSGPSSMAMLADVKCAADAVEVLARKCVETIRRNGVSE